MTINLLYVALQKSERRKSGGPETVSRSLDFKFQFVTQTSRVFNPEVLYRRVWAKDTEEAQIFLSAYGQV